MKILIINNAYPNSNEPENYIFVHKQVKGLQRAGYEVIVMDVDLRSIRWKRKWGYYIDNYDNVKVYRFSFPFVTKYLKKMYVFLSEKIGIKIYKKMIENSDKCDLIHCHFGVGSGNIGVAIKKRYNLPLIITEHSSKLLQGESKFEIKTAMRAYEKANIIISVSETLKSKLQTFGNYSIQVIPNIIDTTVFVPSIVKKQKKFTFISVGSLISRKNHELAIQSFKKFSLDKGKDKVQFWIIGDGDNLKKLKELAKGYENIVFKGHVKNNHLPLLYSQAHCFILASKYETFGIVYAEAIACGIPAISSNCGGPKDIINGNNGLIVEKNNVQNLMEAMNKVYEGYNNYDINELHNSIEKNFSEKIVIEKLVNFYENAVI